MTVQATVKVKDIVHTIHQFEHEHYTCIAHTLEGTHTACPVVAYSLVYTSVVSKGTEIESYYVGNTNRQTDTIHDERLMLQQQNMFLR